jgi:hypothetical protein
MNICALITTCQRPEGLQRTLESLGDMPAIVLQDGGDMYIPDLPNVKAVLVGGPGGKSGYWQRVDKLWTEACHSEPSTTFAWRHFIHLTDDIDFDPDWLEQVLKAYDPTRPLNICVNGRPSCWGFTSYIDGGFIAPRSAFEALNWTIEPIPASRWERNPKLGSGVWAQVTRRWHKLGIVPKMIARDPIRSSFDPSLSIMNPDRE